MVSLGLAVAVFSKIRFRLKIDRQLINKAKHFWLFAVTASVVSLSDCLIISRTLGVKEIIEYNLLCKIFGIASFAYGAVVQGLMPDCSRNLFLQNTEEVIRTVRKHVKISIFGVALFTITVLIFSPLTESFFSLSLGIWGILGFGIYLSSRVIGDFYAMALQSGGILMPFFYLVPIQAVISLFFQYFLSNHVGVCGIPIGMAISYAVTVCLFLPKALRNRVAV
jgi:O-antigen/teichoic acid export membrane protein